MSPCARLYEEAGVRRMRDTLRPGGVLAVWSSAPAPALERRLREAGLRAASLPIDLSAGGARAMHTIVIGQLPAT